MTNLDSILKNKNISLQSDIAIVKVMISPFVVYRCESCKIEKVKHQRSDALKLWYWRRLFRVPWTARRSNKSILKEINSE